MTKLKINLFRRFNEKLHFFKDSRIQKTTGVFLAFFSIYLLISFVSYLFNGTADQDKIFKFSKEVQNIGGTLGNSIAHKFIFDWFGISSFLLALMILMLSVNLFTQSKILPLNKYLFSILALVIWSSVLFDFIFGTSILGGGFGSEINSHLNTLLGKIGTGFILLISVISFVIIKVNPLFKKKEKTKEEDDDEIIDESISLENIEVTKIEPEQDILEDKANAEPNITLETETAEEVNENKISEKIEHDLDIKITTSQEEDTLTNKEIKQKIDELEDYDPTLDLSSYKIPSIKLLKDYGSGKIEIDKSELEANKNRIVQTLNNYKIGISSISATIGPTITLYEIVPEAGIRISKIKNLEDDIALSLSALGIRIIAPIPGKGTIGIEVPNQNPATVSMKSVISSEKFQDSDMELPVAFGKTISNETFVADLTKMPHLLMAGATGQGKSVGLNAILASLLYKKHPSQVKFVLVDPKKVELTLFNKIERHFLAKLPDSEEAIITDTKKVINTLNSLCIEMDQRYDLLQNAHCRNIVEYNKKFIARKLNPLDGHRFLPYIVLVIDEFADLIMTAGKEVETPIARLAQLARAIGIHLIVATQRPSVNVITGIIKANFPARVAFRVTSKIDSRTILDAGGADQLIGRGDMLISLGSELIRLQCAFIDTPEVEEITDFIGNQRAYPQAFLLPEYVNDSEGGSSDADLDDRDVMFEEAARLLVQHQSGSTSLIQRKLKLGYNRAGRIIDQLEAARIVGPFEGSKARQVLVKDDVSLEELLNDLNNK